MPNQVPAVGRPASPSAAEAQSTFGDRAIIGGYLIPIFRYFWFLCAALMIVNIIIWRRRLALLLERGTVTPEEAERFIRGAAFWLVTPCFLLGTISLSAGWSDPFCAGVLSFRNTPSSATALVILGTWAALLSWVWLGHGADVLGRIGPVLLRTPRYDRTFSPSAVRVAVTALILAAGIGGTIAWRQMPRSSPTSPCVFGVSLKTDS